MYTSPWQLAALPGSYQVSISLQERKVFSHFPPPPALFLAKTHFVTRHPSRCIDRHASLPPHHLPWDIRAYPAANHGTFLWCDRNTASRLAIVPIILGVRNRDETVYLQNRKLYRWQWTEEQTEDFTQMWHLLFSNYSRCIFTTDEKQTSCSVLSLPACLETQLSLAACRSICFKRSAFPF